MTGKKQKATSPEPPKAMMEPSSVEVPERHAALARRDQPRR